MSTAILLDAALAVAVRVTIVLGLAGLAYLVARWRGASAAERHLVWMLGTVAALVVPLFGWTLPELRVPVPGLTRTVQQAAPGRASLGTGRSPRHAAAQSRAL